MSLPEELARFLATFIATMRTESVEWEKKHQQDILGLKEAKAISEQRLNEKIKEMEIRFEGHSKRIRMEEQVKNEGFHEFLKAIDKLQDELLERYPQMQRVLVLLIHHHATQLLIEAWNNPNTAQAEDKHDELKTLVLTVTKELAESNDSGQAKKLLPEKTIELIRNR